MRTKVDRKGQLRDSVHSVFLTPRGPWWNSNEIWPHPSSCSVLSYSQPLLKPRSVARSPSGMPRRSWKNWRWPCRRTRKSWLACWKNIKTYWIPNLLWILRLPCTGSCWKEKSAGGYLSQLDGLVKGWFGVPIVASNKFPLPWNILKAFPSIVCFGSLAALHCSTGLWEVGRACWVENLTFHQGVAADHVLVTCNH